MKFNAGLKYVAASSSPTTVVSKSLKVACYYTPGPCVH